MELFILLGVLAFLVEAIVETIKMIYQEGKVQTPVIISLIIGVLISLTVGIDIFKVLEVPVKIPYIGEVLAGVLMSRGGNFIHELFIKLEK